MGPMVGVVVSVIAFFNSAWNGDLVVEVQAARDYFRGMTAAY